MGTPGAAAGPAAAGPTYEVENLGYETCRDAGAPPPKVLRDLQVMTEGLISGVPQAALTVCPGTDQLTSFELSKRRRNLGDLHKSYQDYVTNCPRRKEREQEERDAKRRKQALEAARGLGPKSPDEAFRSPIGGTFEADLAALQAQPKQATKSHMQLGCDLGTGGVVAKGTAIPAVALRTK